MDSRFFCTRARAVVAVLLFLAVAGCGLQDLQNKGMSSARRFVNSGNRLLDLMKSIKDPQSAQAVAADVDETYTELIASLNDVVEYEAEHGQTKGTKGAIQKLERDITQMQTSLAAELERVKAIDGLPVEFWAIVRKQSYALAEPLMQQVLKTDQLADRTVIDQVLAVAQLYREYPATQIVEGDFGGITMVQGATPVEALRKQLPANVRVVEFVSLTGGAAFAAAPITMDELVKAANFVEVAERNDALGSITFRLLGRGEAEAFENEFEQALNEAHQKPQAAPDPVEAIAPAPAPVPTGPPLEFESTHSDALTKHGPGAVLRYELVNFTDLEAAGATSNVHDFMRAFAAQSNDSRTIYQYGWVAPIDNYPAICDYLATIAEIVDRNNAAQSLKLKFNPENLPRPDDEALLKLVSRWMPDASDPDYYKHLSELMWDPEKLEVNEAAVQALLDVEDMSQINKDVRKTVARNFRAIAMEDTIADGRAIDGLVLYGGKYSVPVLIELLDRPAGRIDREIMAALAELKDPRGAVTIAERLANESERLAALAALQEMGPAAEEPLIQAAASDDTLVVRQVIDVLSKMGTRKSYPILRKLSRQPDEEISSAAKKALSTIIYREKISKG